MFSLQWCGTDKNQERIEPGPRTLWAILLHKQPALRRKKKTQNKTFSLFFFWEIKPRICFCFLRLTYVNALWRVASYLLLISLPYLHPAIKLLQNLHIHKQSLYFFTKSIPGNYYRSLTDPASMHNLHILLTFDPKPNSETKLKEQYHKTKCVSHMFYVFYQLITIFLNLSGLWCNKEKKAGYQ